MNCQKCGTKVVPYPAKDEQGKIIWKNLFKMDFMSIMFFIVIIGMLLSYQHDINAFKDIRENPYGYCNDYCATLQINEFILGQPQYNITTPSGIGPTK